MAQESVLPRGTVTTVLSKVRVGLLRLLPAM